MTLQQVSLRIRSIMLVTVIGLIASAAASVSASVCTLADHIRSANTNTAVGFCPAGTSHDVITLTENITLSEPLPPISGTITIEGGGHTISGDGQFRIFDVNGGRLTVKNLTLTEGKAPDAQNGGAIRMRGFAAVTLSYSNFTNNAGQDGGAIDLDNGTLTIVNSGFSNNRANAARGNGGVINASGATIAISNSSFAANRSGGSGGTVYAKRSRISIANSTFHKNRSGSAGGVLLVAESQATLTHLTMMSNWARTRGGDAIYNVDSSVKLRNSIIAGGGRYEDCVGGLGETIGNLSQDGTCGVDTSDDPRLGEMTGSPARLPLLDGSPAIDAASAEYCLESDQLGRPRPFGVGCDIGAIEATGSIPAPTAVPGNCTLRDQIVAANTDQAYKACPAGKGADVIYMVRDYILRAPLQKITSDITIQGNGYTISGDRKFRIFDVDGGKLRINNLTLANGKATELGGAIRVQGSGEIFVNRSRFIENSAQDGGAIGTRFNQVRLAINDSSFNGNAASLYGGAIMMNGGGAATVTNSSFVNNAANMRNGLGGAIDTSYAETVDISNSTFIGNRAWRGGAISAGYAEAVTLAHVTMLDNHARDGAGIWHAEEGPMALRLRNSIVAGGSNRLCNGRLAESVGNLVEDGSCAAAISGDPLLDEPRGAPTTVSLQDGSPAIDAADPQHCLETDQIGTSRPQGGSCDIGAIEMPAPASEAPSASADNPPLTDCAVTTTDALNFRDEPNLAGARIGLVRQGATLDAVDRTAGWFSVDYQGVSGWISAEYVVTEGDCG